MDAITLLHSFRQLKLQFATTSDQSSSTLERLSRVEQQIIQRTVIMNN